MTHNRRRKTFIPVLIVLVAGSLAVSSCIFKVHKVAATGDADPVDTSVTPDAAGDLNRKQDIDVPTPDLVKPDDATPDLVKPDLVKPDLVKPECDNDDQCAGKLNVDQCWVEFCDKGTGQCGKKPQPDGEQCDDGMDCTVDDACQGALCKGKPGCEATDPCEEGSCGPGGKCVFKFNPALPGCCWDDGETFIGNHPVQKCCNPDSMPITYCPEVAAFCGNDPGVPCDPMICLECDKAEDLLCAPCGDGVCNMEFGENFCNCPDCVLLTNWGMLFTRHPPTATARLKSTSGRRTGRERNRWCCGNTYRCLSA